MHCVEFLWAVVSFTAVLWRWRAWSCIPWIIIDCGVLSQRRLSRGSRLQLIRVSQRKLGAGLDAVGARKDLVFADVLLPGFSALFLALLQNGRAFYPTVYLNAVLNKLSACCMKKTTKNLKTKHFTLQLILLISRRNYDISVWIVLWTCNLMQISRAVIMCAPVRSIVKCILWWTIWHRLQRQHKFHYNSTVFMKILERGYR